MLNCPSIKSSIAPSIKGLKGYYQSESKITMKKVEILIVDDEAIIAQDLKMNVNEMGYSGFSVSSGKEAIRKISGNYEPDLILMDVSLKGEANGIQTARVIQKLRKIPVLFVTALSRSTVLKQIKDLVLTGYIQKPFCKEELQGCIRELLAAA
jgi:CheY-like chemotaxis protein